MCAQSCSVSMRLVAALVASFAFASFALASGSQRTIATHGVRVVRAGWLAPHGRHAKQHHRPADATGRGDDGGEIERHVDVPDCRLPSSGSRGGGRRRRLENSNIRWRKLDARPSADGGRRTRDVAWSPSTLHTVFPRSR